MSTSRVNQHVDVTSTLYPISVIESRLCTQIRRTYRNNVISAVAEMPNAAYPRKTKISCAFSQTWALTNIKQIRAWTADVKRWANRNELGLENKKHQERETYVLCAYAGPVRRIEQERIPFPEQLR